MVFGEDGGWEGGRAGGCMTLSGLWSTAQAGLVACLWSPLSLAVLPPYLVVPSLSSVFSLPVLVS